MIVRDELRDCVPLRLSGRFDVHQNVGHPRQFLLERGADARGNLVGRHHSHRGINLDVHVDVVLQSCFPGEEFLNAQYPWNRHRNIAGRINQSRRRHCVGEFERGIAQRTTASDDDDDSDGEAPVMVRGEEPGRIV